MYAEVRARERERGVSLWCGVVSAQRTRDDEVDSPCEEASNDDKWTGLALKRRSWEKQEIIVWVESVRRKK